MALCSYCGAPLEPAAAGVSAACAFCGAAAPIARPEAAPVQVVQRIVSVVSAGEASPDLGRCPHCRRVFGSVKVGEVELHGCASCGGIWLDNESAQKVMENPEYVFSELAARAAQGAATGRARDPRPGCPRCSAVLDRTRFNDIDLDICPEHGTWFDARELGVVVATLREARRERELDASGGSVACAACRKVVLRRATHVTAEGVVCDECHVAAQQRELAATATPSTFSSSVLMALHQELYKPK